MQLNQGQINACDLTASTTFFFERDNTCNKSKHTNQGGVRGLSIYKHAVKSKGNM